MRVESDADRIHWAVRLLEEDVATLHEAGLRRLWRELGAFLNHTSPKDSLGIGVRGSGRGAAAVRTRMMEHMRATIGACQKEGRSLLEQHVRGREVAATFEGPLTITARTTEGRFSFRTGGRDAAFRLTLTFLLCGESGGRVRECPECGRFFVRVRRQIYCSARCTDRATWRNYPEHKKRRLRKQQYEKQGWRLGARKKKGK